MSGLNVSETQKGFSMEKDLLQTLLDLEKENKIEEIQSILKDKQYRGNPIIDYYKAHLYYIGFIYEKDLEKSMQHLKGAAIKNYASACYMLSLAYERGDGVDVDLSIANEYLLKAAEQNYLPAVNHYGEILLMGRLDFKIDQERGFDLFRQCSAAGYDKGRINYAYCLCYKVGNDGNYEEGFKMLNELAEKGYPEAMYNLGKIYFEGYGTRRDIIRANYFLLRATEMGHLFAAKMMGDCYYDGIGVAIDHKLAYKYYKRAADLGNNEAAQLVANCLIAGDGVKMNFEEAIAYCVKAAHGGDSEAQVSLGNRYFYGDGLRRNYERAVYWFQEAAKQNNAIGLKNTADMLVEGKGCKKDIKKAIEYYARAVDLNYYDAAAPLAYLYETGGKVIRKNYELAVKYYQIAYEDNDDGYAAMKYADLVSEGKGVPYPEYTKATKAYEFGAHKEIMRCIKKAGEAYLKGIGVNRDYERALRYYLDAAKLGDEESAILVNLIRRSMEFSSY